MASPVSEVPIGRTQSPQPMKGQGFTTILCDGTFRDRLPSGLRSPWSARGRSGPWPADGSQDLFWQLAARRAAAASSMRLQRKWIWTGYSSSSSVVSAALYNLESAGAGRPAASPVMGQQFRLQFIQFIWQEYIPNLLNAFFIITEIWQILLSHLEHPCSLPPWPRLCCYLCDIWLTWTWMIHKTVSSWSRVLYHNGPPFISSVFPFQKPFLFSVAARVWWIVVERARLVLCIQL